MRFGQVRCVPYTAGMKETHPLAKLLVLGDSAVGKSSLLLRFSENRFDPNFVLTIGVDFRTKVMNVDGRRIKLQVWDTAGQERFRTITPAYFRSAMGVLLVYDTTNEQTFHNVRRWMQNVEDFAEKNVVRVLIGNKLDLRSKRQVSHRRGELLAKEFGIPFFETSAKSNTNVEEAFTCVAKKIIELRFPEVTHETRKEGESSSGLPCTQLGNGEYRGGFVARRRCCG